MKGIVLAGIREIAAPMLKNQYGQYLLKVIDECREDINSTTLTHQND